MAHLPRGNTRTLSGIKQTGAGGCHGQDRRGVRNLASRGRAGRQRHAGIHAGLERLRREVAAPEIVKVGGYIEHHLNDRDSHPLALEHHLNDRDGHPLALPSKKQHLAALRHFFDNQQMYHGVVLSPASSVRGLLYVAREGKTPPYARQVRKLLDSIDTSHVVGVRDKTLLMVLAYTAARAGAGAKLKVEDYHFDGLQWTDQATGNDLPPEFGA